MPQTLSCWGTSSCAVNVGLRKLSPTYVLNVSQQEMAEALGTSVDTIKSWESRRRNPTGLAAKVLATIADNPSLFRELAAH